MINVKVYSVIDKEDIFLSMLGFEDFVFSADTVHRVFEQNAEETEFKFNINCDGGSVAEGLRIYDVLRTSGKTLFTNIEGSCHSMAVVLLLAAPKENRTANPNCRSLIHEVRGGFWDATTATELRDLADLIEKEQNSILDIYADRTGHDRTELENLMKEEKNRTAQELLNYGFISKINSYSTNKKTNSPMIKNQKKPVELLNKVDKFLKGLKNLLDGEVVNYDHTDDAGTVLFTTEKEDDSLAVGDLASPDGTFELTDGRSVTIADGAVTEIVEATTELSTEDSAETVEALNLQVEALTNALNEAKELIVNLNTQVTSNFQVSPRTKTVGKPTNVLSVEELTNQAREKRAKMKGENK